MALRDRAKRAARSAKEKFSGGRDDILEISQMGDQWIVIDGEDTHGPWKDRKKAAAKYRQLKRAKKTATSGRGVSDKLKGAAGTAKRGAQKLSEAGETVATGEGGPDPETFAQSTGLGNGSSGPQLPGMGGQNGMEPAFASDDGGSGEPQIPMVQGAENAEPMFPEFGGSMGEPGFPMDDSSGRGRPRHPYEGHGGPARADTEGLADSWGMGWGGDEKGGEPRIPMLDDEQSRDRGDDEQPPWML